MKNLSKTVIAAVVANTVTLCACTTNSGQFDPPTSTSKAPSPATSSSGPSRRSMSEFKQLPLAQGNSLAGYSGEGVISAQEVVNRFGNPSKTEDVGDFFNSKVLYYPATDEFGNPCSAALVFYRGNAEGCGNAGAPLRCYGLYNVAAR